jgi:hypothetical protein
MQLVAVFIGLYVASLLAVHAVVLGINKAIEDEEPAPRILELLKTPIVAFQSLSLLISIVLHWSYSCLAEANAETYRVDLIEARKAKVTRAHSKRPSLVEGEEPRASNEDEDVYDTNLTKAEIQSIIVLTNKAAIEGMESSALAAINHAVDAKDVDALGSALTAEHAHIAHVAKAEAQHYLRFLVAAKHAKDGQVLTRADVQSVVDETNRLVEIFHAMEGSAEALLRALATHATALALPDLDPEAIELYRKALLAALAANGGRPVRCCLCV